MDKYIKAQDLIDRIYPVDPENDGSDGCTVVYKSLTLSSTEIEAIVEELPAADFAPVVHGKWERKYTANGIVTRNVCTNCNEWVPLQIEPYSFCPYCGARMDGGQHETD